MSIEATSLSSDAYVVNSHASRITWRSYLRESVAHRYLLRNLVLRDLKARYKNSMLGILWSLLNPLFMMVVYTALFTVLTRGSNIRPFYIFVLVALVPWQFLSSVIMSGTVSITSNSALVKKVYFPRVLLPLTALLSNFVNFLFASTVLVMFLYISGIGLTIHALWVLPILLTQMIFMLGLVMLFSALHVFYRDIQMILDVGILAWFFLTPIFYPFEELTRHASVMGFTFDAARVMRWLNPMASIIDGYRTVLWGTVNSQATPGSMEPLALLRTFVTAVLVFIVGYVVFTRAEHLFGEKL